MAVNIFLYAGRHMVLVSFALVFQNLAESVPQGIEPLSNLKHIRLLLKRAVSFRVGGKDFLKGILPIREKGEG